MWMNTGFSPFKGWRSRCRLFVKLKRDGIFVIMIRYAGHICHKATKQGLKTFTNAGNSQRRNRTNTSTPTMHSQPSLRLLLLLLPLLLTLFLSQLRPVPAAGSPAPAPADGSDFIRASCNVTLYPDVCYATLARYAASIRRDPARLARAAIAVSLARARRVAECVSSLLREADYGADRRATAALHDCFENFGDAADEMWGSLKQMRQLGAAGSGEQSFRFQMSNVQTWMSAALTDEETCTDGFEDVADGPVKSGVCGRAGAVKKVTSNALALVNSYVNKQAGP